ncbi:heme exporter protein CcmD [Bradyrhizobium sp. SSUT18]|uniref:heme exporter protein CcmD n=1 Tax=unclassified Bradyrhizobium TaxID=2631580 RepID=UPI00244AB4E5|nr:MULTISPECIES: heme exporter protein CcmD [unclassified Bradyrhizobium]MDH2346606.1 heme exporter protein CcmD [Bradyrhizobium sp. SSUT77]MDH2406825.1 heme exporter protein CcmD [Bradyrhizobium sp. SSUT18]
MTMSLGPYASFILTSYAAAALVVVILIGWIVLDYRSQTLRLRELDRSGITRRSGRSATDRS